MSVDSNVYAVALAQMMQGGVDLNAGTVRITAVTSGYVFNDAHDFYDDITAGFRLGTPMTLTSKTFGVAGKGKFAAAGGTYTGLAVSDAVDGFVGHIWTGSDATSRVVWYLNHRSDTVEIAYTSDGNGLTIAWPLGFIFSI